MKRTDFTEMACPIARGVGHVGEWWSMLVLREAMYGVTRFDEFEKNLNIAPNMLTRRLSDLVGSGLMIRRQYQDRPPRFEYVLTEAGVAFQPVLLALAKWGNEYLSPEGASIVMADRATGEPVAPVLVDEKTGRALHPDNVKFIPGPMATERITARLARAEQRHAEKITAAPQQS
ncbi:MAG: winged helix-turn-helix transcriptional regulator [Massilia sp.]